MPIYLLQHFHKIIPTNGEVWSLGREMAFHARNDEEAVAIGKKHQAGRFAPFGELTLVIDPNGRQVWESTLATPAAPVPRDVPNQALKSA